MSFKEFKKGKVAGIADQLLYVAQAVAKAHAVGFCLTHIYAAENGDVVASDGHRVHLATTAPGTLDAGFYRVVKITKTLLQIVKVDEHVGEFPQYQNIMGADTDNFTTLQVDDTPRFGRFANYARVLRAMPENRTIDTDLLDQACNGKVNEIKVSSGDDPVFINGENVRACLMPMKL